LARLQASHPSLDKLIKTLLRSHSGIFDEFVKINETEISSRSGLKSDDVIRHLERLDKMGAIAYRPSSDKPSVIYLRERVPAVNLHISPENLSNRKKRFQKRVRAMCNYVTATQFCRSRMLLDYFGERDSNDCGDCDVCRKKLKGDLKRGDFDAANRRIISVLKSRDLSMQELMRSMKPMSEMHSMVVIRKLLDDGTLMMNIGDTISLRKD